ncbi:hypothetical protein VKT23_008612 [Stygiomarasmius scandens]|uniref:LysM domain-containing protein n=1 Tax=Marasmiellus scandens TaxID=2682957 RepID=A0ABR1JGX9_9AGAR
MLRIVSAAIVSAALLVSAQVSSDCARTYTVVAGDFCDKISAENNASTFQIANANPDTINSGCTNLVPDQVICLGLTGLDCSTTTTVAAGTLGTCNDVANATGISVETLFHNNPNINSTCGNIYGGEVLCTSAELFDYNTTSSS